MKMTERIKTGLVKNFIDCKVYDLLKHTPADRFNSTAFYHPNSIHYGTSNCQE